MKSIGRRTANKAGTMIVNSAFRRFQPSKSFDNRTSSKIRIDKRQSLQKQIAALQRSFNKIAPEIKYSDQDIDTVNIGISGTFQNVLNITQGDTVALRTGNHIVVKSIHLKALVRPEAYATFDPATLMRFYLIQDKQGLGAGGFSIADVFSPVASFEALPNIAQLHRFNILWESRPLYPRMFQQGAGFVPTDTGYLECNLNTSIDVEYPDTGVTKGKNLIYFVCLCSDTSGGPQIDLTGTCRIGFTDS